MNQSNNVELQTSQRNLPMIEPAQIVEMNRTIGSKVIFTCPRGYGLQGSNHELECLPSGHWSGSIPYCQGIVLFFFSLSWNFFDFNFYIK